MCAALGTVDIDLTMVDPLGPTPVRVVKDILPYRAGIAPVTQCGCLQKQTVAGARGWQLSSTVPSTKPYFLALVHAGGLTHARRGAMYSHGINLFLEGANNKLP